MGREIPGAWRVADDVAWTVSGEIVVALELDSPDAHPVTLQQSAAYIWEELVESGPVTADDLAALIADAYDVEVDTVRDQVLSLLEKLRRAGLISSELDEARTLDPAEIDAR